MGTQLRGKCLITGDTVNLTAIQCHVGAKIKFLQPNIYSWFMEPDQGAHRKGY